ncbi:unnamed protein product [Protopolystoma xenopodis]|uniref:Uncharacterized protein n=1 Tax=Protopolystoma xenopodis TaxID=117903 RepID=A0A3S5FFU5_9PLAT|nr:unnamed protein product [Protopolystoma xenopodis]
MGQKLGARIQPKFFCGLAWADKTSAACVLWESSLDLLSPVLVSDFIDFYTRANVRRWHGNNEQRKRRLRGAPGRLNTASCVYRLRGSSSSLVVETKWG